jgi:hypothetical protein
MKINKKGVMGMSISTVVMLIIAIVFIGAAVIFIRNIFPTDLPKVIEPTLNPTSETPLVTRTENIEIKTGREVSLNVGFYNRQQNTANVEIAFRACVPPTNVNENICGGDIRPIFRSLNWEVEVGESVEFITRVKASCFDENGEEMNLPPGTYICGLEAIDDEKIIENKAITLTVTT